MQIIFLVSWWLSFFHHGDTESTEGTVFFTTEARSYYFYHRGHRGARSFLTIEDTEGHGVFYTNKAQMPENYILRVCVANIFPTHLFLNSFQPVHIIVGIHPFVV